MPQRCSHMIHPYLVLRVLGLLDLDLLLLGHLQLDRVANELRVLLDNVANAALLLDEKTLKWIVSMCMERT
jgi:hypothetical protein